MVDLLSTSNQVQSVELSLHPQVFKWICLNWFTPHIDLFATRLNLKVTLNVSQVSDQNALNMLWLDLTACLYPPTALLHRVIRKIRQSSCLIIVIAPRDALVMGPSAAFNRDPISTTSVKNSSQTVPQLKKHLLSL